MPGLYLGNFFMIQTKYLCGVLMGQSISLL